MLRQFYKSNPSIFFNFCHRQGKCFIFNLLSILRAIKNASFFLFITKAWVGITNVKKRVSIFDQDSITIISFIKPRFCSCVNTTFFWSTNGALITFCFPAFNISPAVHSIFTQCWLSARLSYGHKQHEYFVHLDCSRSRKLIIFKSTYMVYLWLSDLINFRTVLISSYFSFICTKYAMRI